MGITLGTAISLTVGSDTTDGGGTPPLVRTLPEIVEPNLIQNGSFEAGAQGWFVNAPWQLADDGTLAKPAGTSAEFWQDVSVPVGSVVLAYRITEANDQIGVTTLLNGPLQVGPWRRRVGCHAVPLQSVGHVRVTLRGSSNWGGKVTGFELYDLNEIETRPADVYILAGQSNMVGGAAEDLDPQLDSFHPLVSYVPSYTANEYSAVEGEAIPAVDPLQHMLGISRGVGPGLPFAHEMVKSLEAGRRIVLIATAQGGTSLYTNWAPETGPQFLNAVDKSLAALQALPAGSKVKGMLWSQGETDSSTNVGAIYPPAFAAMLAALRGAIRVPDLPCVILGPTPEGDIDGRLAAAQAGLDQDATGEHAILGVRYVPGLAGHAIPGEAIHFTARGNRLRGVLGAQAMLPLT